MHRGLFSIRAIPDGRAPTELPARKNTPIVRVQVAPGPRFPYHSGLGSNA